MPRIRTVKPEFWGDEKLAPMAAIDRLVFLGLISMADDAGRLVDNVKSIDGFIFPDTEESSRDSLDTLASAGRILRYRSESGQRLIQVANWLKHQKVDKPSRHVLPPPHDARETVASDSRSDRGPTTVDLGPTTTVSHSAGETPVHAVLPTAADRGNLDALLASAPSPAPWLAEMQAALDGMPGHRAVTPAQLATAIADYVGNGDSGRPNLAHFRGYLRRAAAPVRVHSDRGKPNPGAQMVANIIGTRSA